MISISKSQCTVFGTNQMFPLMVTVVVVECSDGSISHDGGGGEDEGDGSV